MKLVKFSTASGMYMYININKILYIEGNEYTTVLFLESGTVINVDGGVGEVVVKLVG